MCDALRARISWHVFHCFPAYRDTGGRITYIAPDSTDRSTAAQSDPTRPTVT